MADEVENLTLALLREIRAGQVAMQNDINDLRADMREVKPAVSLVEVLSSPGMTTHLHTRYGAAIEEAIAKVKASRGLENIRAFDGASVYAYPHGEGIAWGVNAHESGLNILRGVRRPDGSDEAEG
jgi:hypothetical protein